MRSAAFVSEPRVRHGRSAVRMLRSRGEKGDWVYGEACSIPPVFMAQSPFQQSGNKEGSLGAIPPPRVVLPTYLSAVRVHRGNGVGNAGQWTLVDAIRPRLRRRNPPSPLGELFSPREIPSRRIVNPETVSRTLPECEVRREGCPTMGPIRAIVVLGVRAFGERVYSSPFVRADDYDDYVCNDVIQ